MEITYKKPAELTPYENNTKVHPPEQIDRIAESIKRFGFQQPIVVDRDNVVIIGHGRLLAAKQLLLDAVPVVCADELTEEQAQALRLADNKTNESSWDFGKLEEELAALSIAGFDMTAFGFDDISELGSVPPEITEDEPPEPPEEPKAKRGEIYRLGNHRLMCGDSTNREDVAELMGGQRADMVFTDPPYGMNAVSKSGMLSEHYNGDILGDDDNTVAVDGYKLAQELFKNSKQVWWGANYYSECLPSAECWIVWDKNNGESDQTDAELAWTNFRSVVRKFVMTSEKINRVHPTQKPCRLFGEILKKFDKNGEIKTVLDLFGGSGSTLLACEQTGRKCFMMELDPHYIDVIIQRWENLTGQTAELIKGVD